MSCLGGIFFFVDSIEDTVQLDDSCIRVRSISLGFLGLSYEALYMRLGLIVIWPLSRRLEGAMSLVLCDLTPRVHNCWGDTLPFGASCVWALAESSSCCFFQAWYRSQSRGAVAVAAWSCAFASGFASGCAASGFAPRLRFQRFGQTLSLALPFPLPFPFGCFLGAPHCRHHL